MPAKKSRSTAEPKLTARTARAGRKTSSPDEAAMPRECEALLAKINRGVDEAIARADWLLARIA